MRQIETTRFGQVQVSEDSVITIPSGLVGLSRYTRFVVIEEEKHPTFQWLQAVDEPGLALVVVEASLVTVEFQVEIPDDAIAEIELCEADPVGLYVIVTIPQGQPERATVNLRGPIVINLRTRKAKQLVLHEAWPVKYPLCFDPDSADGSENGRKGTRQSSPGYAAPGLEQTNQIK